MKNGLNSTQNDVVKKEFCEVCGISPSTAYKLLKSEKVHFEKCRNGLVQFYSIPMDEITKYLDEKSNRGKLSETQIELLQSYYTIKMKDYPDVIKAYSGKLNLTEVIELVEKSIIELTMLFTKVQEKYL